MRNSLAKHDDASVIGDEAPASEGGRYKLQVAESLGDWETRGADGGKHSAKDTHNEREKDAHEQQV